MNTKGSSILISGASFAGPALAYWLRRFGFTPTVIERAPLSRNASGSVGANALDPAAGTPST